MCQNQLRGIFELGGGGFPGGRFAVSRITVLLQTNDCFHGFLAWQNEI